MTNIHSFQKFKQLQEKITMVTCYDYSFARVVNQSPIHCILVGDSAAMVMHGHDSTVAATIDMMCVHTQAVRRGAPDKFIIGDLPFLSYRQGHDVAMNNIQRLMQAGAQAIKLEGAAGNIELIRYCVESGVPIMGHLGLTPQAIHQLGGFRVQGKTDDAANRLIEEAKALEQAGCFAIVLECVPSHVAKAISLALTIPTIGIGAGPDTDGQVLVLQDMLGLQNQFTPKFLKRYLDGVALVQAALNDYHQEVQQVAFPEQQHCYQ